VCLLPRLRTLCLIIHPSHKVRSHETIRRWRESTTKRVPLPRRLRRSRLFWHRGALLTPSLIAPQINGPRPRAVPALSLHSQTMVPNLPYSSPRQPRMPPPHRILHIQTRMCAPASHHLAPSLTLTPHAQHRSTQVLRNDLRRLHRLLPCPARSRSRRRPLLLRARRHIPAAQRTLRL
jgi:hypothetical protein